MSSTQKLDDIDDLPGAALVHQGWADLQANKRTPEALLLLPVTPRLSTLGLILPATTFTVEEPELELYDALCRLLDGPNDDPYYRYNSWRREVDSFVAALEHRRAGARSAQAAG